MIAAGYGTVSDFEIVWTLIAGVGVIFSIFNWRGIYEQYQYVKDLGLDKRNGRWLLAKAALVTEAGRLYLQLFFLTVGIYVMTRPEAEVDISNFNEIMATIIRWGFLLGAVCVCGKTIYTWYIRKRLIEMDGTKGGENGNL